MLMVGALGAASVGAASAGAVLVGAVEAAAVGEGASKSASICLASTRVIRCSYAPIRPPSGLNCREADQGKTPPVI